MLEHTETHLCPAGPTDVLFPPPSPLGEEATVSGWGLTNETDDTSVSHALMHVTVPIVSTER